MRIEKIGPKSYSKVMDKAESEISNIMNQYFNSTIFEDGSKNSREAMISEVTRRLQPLIMQLAQSMAYKEIQKYVSTELGGYIDGKIIELMSTVKKMSIRYETRKLLIRSADNRKVVILPQDLVIDLTKDIIIVLVNGGEQELTENYELIMNSERPTKVYAINFSLTEKDGDILEEGDIVTINALIYSDGGVSA